MSTFRSRNTSNTTNTDLALTKKLVYRRPRREPEKPLLPVWVWEGLMHLIFGVLIGACLACAYVLVQILVGG